tara:strand:- start:615 stop:806 length:192 start_codon:yes stop_codon:yes gene_type:complete
MAWIIKEDHRATIDVNINKHPLGNLKAHQVENLDPRFKDLYCIDTTKKTKRTKLKHYDLEVED